MLQKGNQARKVDSFRAARSQDYWFPRQLPPSPMMVVCTENLTPGVAVMETAQDGKRFDVPGSLNRTRDRRIFIQGSVRSDVIVIARIGSQDSTQMGLAENDDMIQALATDRPDQPFGKAILPR